MVDHGEPLSRLVGPVPREEGALAVDVLSDIETTCGYAVVCNVEVAQLTGYGRRGECDGEMVVDMGVVKGGAVAGYARDSHSLSIYGCCEIQEEAGNAAFEEANGDSGVAVDRIGGVIECECEPVVLHIDRWLSGIGIPGSRRMRRGGDERDCGTQYQNPKCTHNEARWQILDTIS